MSEGHDKKHGGGHESPHGSPIEKAGSWLMGGFTKLALAFGILLAGVTVAQAALPVIATAATGFLSGSVVLPNSVLVGAAGGFALGRMSKGGEAKKEKPAAHGAAHH